MLIPFFQNVQIMSHNVTVTASSGNQKSTLWLIMPRSLWGKIY